jgi:hypothetical protein
MATQKGTTVIKASVETLRLEIMSPHAKTWGVVVEAETADEDQVKHLRSIANSLKSGPVKYRVIEIKTTTRIATSERVIEGEGAEKAPAKTTPPPKP